jgi:hypothetical protein
MNKPLTPEQIQIVRQSLLDDEEALDAAIARLDFLERKVKASEAVVSAARALVSRAVGLGPCLADYVAVHHALAAWDAVPGDDTQEKT